MAAIKITETQLLLFDLALVTAIRYLIGEHRRVMEADEAQLKQMAEDADQRLGTTMDIIRARQGQ